MNDTNQQLEAIQHLLAELLNAQQQSNRYIADLAEAISGVPRTEKENQPKPETEKPQPVDDEIDAAAATIEAEPVAAVTLADLRNIFAEKSRSGKKDRLRDLLSSYGVKKLPELDEAKYSEVAQKAGEL